MTDAITKPKKDEPEEPRKKGTEPVSPMGWVGTGSVPVGEAQDDDKDK
jgi:hypothetical protein